MRIIAELVRALPRGKPGVYRMIAADGEVLDVAKSALAAQSGGFLYIPSRPKLATRLIRMVSATRTMEFAVTDSEGRGAAPRKTT